MHAPGTAGNSLLPADRTHAGRSRIAAIAVATVLPRLVALVHERGSILRDFTFGEKSDDIARTFLDSGTFGFIPGHPSAYTQPLYSFFLIPLYETLGRTWPVVGGAQISSPRTACVVFEIGRRWVSGWVGLIAALLTTLHPYSIWHDVHVNREILDGLLGGFWSSSSCSHWASRRVVGPRRSSRCDPRCRDPRERRMAALPVVLAIFLLWIWKPSRRTFGALALTSRSASSSSPQWVVRNRVEVGCYALTTDARDCGRPITNAPRHAESRPLDRQRTAPTGLSAKPSGCRAGVSPSRQDRLGPGMPTGDVLSQAGTHVLARASSREGPARRTVHADAVEPEGFTYRPRRGYDERVESNRVLIEPVYMTPIFLLAIVGLLAFHGDSPPSP